MIKLKTLRITFDTEIRNWEIRSFRGAMAKKVGYEHEWFHNHNNSGRSSSHTNFKGFSSERFHYRYPMIQYKTDRRGNKLRPMLLCLGDCVDEAHKFFSQPNWDVSMNGNKRPLAIANLDINQYNLQVWETDFNYNVFNWLALNTENYLEYRELDALTDKLLFIENLLNQHVVALYRSLNVELEQKAVAKITELRREKWLEYKKGYKLLGFDLSFRANVFIPEYLGIGKGVSKGFGVVRIDNKK